MASCQPATSTAATALDNREHLFRLQMLIIDGGLLVVRSYADQKLTASASSLSACLANEKSTINRLRGNKTITKVQYDLLFPSSRNVSTSDLDITLIICLLRNLKLFGLNPKYNWNTLPAPGDTSIEAAIYNLKRYRNEMSHASTTTGIQHSTFKALWKEIKEILFRINSFSANPITDLKQTIKDFKSCPIDPKTEKRVNEEIEKWRELEKAVKVEISVVKADHKRMLEDVKEVKGAIARMELENKTKDNFDQIMTESQYQQRKQEIKEKLIKFYKDKRSTVPLSPLLEEVETNLAGFYVMPEMVFVEQTSLTSHQEERTSVESLRSLFITESEDQQKIYLSADAGFGKTSFSKYLAMTWVQACCPDKNQDCFKDDEIEALADFEFLFLVLLRDSNTVCTIDEMIEQEIIQKLSPSEIKYPLQEILRRENCLIILDGLDEWTHLDNGCSDNEEKIPHRYARDNCVILTTTRPWKLGVSNLKTSDIDKKVELVKLNQDSTSQLEKNAIRKMSGVSDDNELKEKVHDFHQDIVSRDLEHMLTTPLLLMYITCLWCNKIPIGNSKVEVYINIIEFLLSRTTEKHPEIHLSSEPFHSDIPELFKKTLCKEHNCEKPNCEKHKLKFCQKFYSLLTALAELAYRTLFNEKRENTLVFDKSVAEKYLKADDMNLCLLSGILTGSTTTTLIERTSKVAFSHKTVQELFATLFISSQSNGQKTVLEKCKTVQNIFDMSMICEFLSRMNSKMMCEIWSGLTSVINEDEETLNYRTSTLCSNILNEPLFNIQKMLLSYYQEMPQSENLKLCLQDFFIDDDNGTVHNTHLQRLSKLNNRNMKTLYINLPYDNSSSLHEVIESFSLTDLNNLHKLRFNGDREKESDFSLLLYPSLQNLELSFATMPNYGGQLSEKLETLKNLQYLNIEELTLSHEILEILCNVISGNQRMKELRLYQLFCKEHWPRNCNSNFDFSIKHSQLKEIILVKLPSLNLTVTSQSLVKVDMWGIDLGESSLLLSHDMLNIEYLILAEINISAESFRDFIHVVEGLPQPVTVNMMDCRTNPYSEYERVRNYIFHSHSFDVIQDCCNGWVFIFRTKENK